MTLSACFDLVMSCFFCFQEELAEGLHLIDFEQLKIENQTYNEKIEERNEVGWVFVCFFLLECSFCNAHDIFVLLVYHDASEPIGLRCAYIVSTFNC